MFFGDVVSIDSIFQLFDTICEAEGLHDRECLNNFIYASRGDGPAKRRGVSFSYRPSNGPNRWVMRYTHQDHNGDFYTDPVPVDIYMAAREYGVKLRYD